MTFSIVGRLGAAHGVAVASKFLAVGAAVPAAAAQIGALATQSYANLAYRPQGMSLLATGVTAAGVVAGLTAADPGRDSRQLGVVGSAGDGATFTGSRCHPWAGGVAGDGFAIQGNILAGPQVVEAMHLAWLATAEDTTADPAAGDTTTADPTTGDPTTADPTTADPTTSAAGAAGPAAPASLARRLLAALLAGDRAGGDRRGRQSAALLVVAKGQGYGGTSDVVVDLRVDDHADPVAELARLLDLHALYFGKPDPAALLELRAELADEVRARLAALGYASVNADATQTLDAALANWAGVENLEERIVAGRIDPLVLAHLRSR